MLPTVIHRRPVRRGHAAFGADFDRLFNGLFEAPSASRAFAATDLFETEEAFGLELEMPGFAESEIEVTVDKGVLTVSAERSSDESEEGRTYHVKGRSRERLVRSFSLPSSVRAEEVEADLVSGVLNVTLPKTPEAKPHRVEISGSAS